MSSTYFTDSVSDLCQGIIDKVDTYEKRIKYLGEENKKLKDDHYKDSEMQRMKTELKKAKDDLYRGFPISEKEQEKIREWQLKHDAEKHGLKTSKQRAMGHIFITIIFTIPAAIIIYIAFFIVFLVTFIYTLGIKEEKK